MQNTKINAIYVHVKTTYCFHKPKFLKLKTRLMNTASKIVKIIVTQSTPIGIFAVVVLIFRKNKADFVQFEGNHSTSLFYWLIIPKFYVNLYPKKGCISAI